MSDKNDLRLKFRKSRSRSRSPLSSNIKSKCLLISNIPFNTTLNDLRDLFKEKIGICGRVEYIEKNGKFIGNATMHFKTLEGAQKAIDTMHRQEINGREIIVREQTDKDRERLSYNKKDDGIDFLKPNNSNSSLAQLVNDLERDGPITTSIFISNLDFTLPEQKLRDMFKSAGRVLHVDIKTDADGKSRGFGTIEFETQEEAVLAIHLFNHKIVNNRDMRIRMDKSGRSVPGPKDLSRFTETNNSSIMSNNSNPQIKHLLEELLIASSNPTKNQPQAMKALDDLLVLSRRLENPVMTPSNILGMSMRGDRGVAEKFTQNYDNGNSHFYRVVPGGLPSGYNEFANAHRDYPPGLSREVPFGEGGKIIGSFSSGKCNCGVLDMSGLEEVLFKMKNAGNLDPNSLMTVISNVMKQNHEPSFSSPNNNLFSNPRQSQDFCRGNSSPTLIIKNIPFSYTWKDLQMSFSQISGIENIDIPRDDFNRSKGIGVVRFKTFADAMRCKNLMDGTLMDGRPIHIEINNSS